MKLERLNKKDLETHCQSLGIDTKGKKKDELLKICSDMAREKIDLAINEGRGLELLKEEIKKVANEYATNLDSKIVARKEEMQSDDTGHYLIYRVLGIREEDGRLIDEYQNTGRFLYKYAGSFLEEVATMCVFFANRDGKKTLVKNTLGVKPKTFEIDFLNGLDAIELKWRDATTDGDHITKEHTRVKAIKGHGYKPIRVMFYYPQRSQAIRIQETLKTIYAGVGGEYYAGEDAWDYLEKISGYDLKEILIEIADERTPN